MILIRRQCSLTTSGKKEEHLLQEISVEIKKEKPTMGGKNWGGSHIRSSDANNVIGKTMVKEVQAGS